MTRIRNYASAWFALTALLLLIGGSSIAETADTNEPAPRTVLRNPEVGPPVTPFLVDVDVRDLAPEPQWKPGDPVREIPMRRYPVPGSMPVPGEPLAVDPLVNRQMDLDDSGSDSGSGTGAVRGSGGFSTPTRTFAGGGFTGVNPPDTNGDVGPDHYIQTINASGGTDVRIWDKAEPTPNQLASFRLDNLGTGSCASGLGDPVVLYDREADRWLLTEFSNSGNFLCVYISQTNDPVSGGWAFYSFQMPSFPDYPKYGIWTTDANDGDGSYIVTANDGGPGAIALDRGAILAGEAATFQRFTMSELSGFSIQGPTPATQDGPDTPPGGSPAIIMRHRDTEVHGGPSAPGDVLELWLFDVDWDNPGNTTLIQSSDIDVADFDSTVCGLGFVGCFAQPGSGTTLMPIREVIMNRLQYFNHGTHETLMGSFVVDVANNNQGGVRWFEVRRTGGGPWTTHQEGTYSIDSENRWMSSVAMDQSENVALAYNIVSSSTFPSLRYTGREADDAPGLMTQPEGTIHAGSAANSSFRYGDYASIDLDPEDDCTFWFTGMDNSSSSWRTQVASFGFDACGCELEPSPVVLTAQVVADNEVELSWTDADLATVVEYAVQRSRTPGGPYTSIATVADTSPGVAGGPDLFFTDPGVSGGLTYYYIVRASDGDRCKSDPSNEASADAVGSCTLPPIFGGLQSVSTPQNNNCTLDLAWVPGVAECGGPLSYNIYRSQSPAFTPGPGNLVAGNLTTTVFSDIDQLINGQQFYYVVRAVDTANGVEEQNTKQISGAPQGVAGGVCTTVSACADNPFVDVQPDGPLTACERSGFLLEAVPNGGTGNFLYQWTRDGADIPGATSSFYLPDALGTHAYNVKIQAETCPGFVFDGMDSEITLVNQPFFDGITAVTNPQEPVCGLDVSWDAGTTVCDGPVRYFVYRDTQSPVNPTPDKLVAAGVLGTTFRDSSDLANRQDYHYLVRAQDADTGYFDDNTAEASAFPDGPGSGPQAVLDEDFENTQGFATSWTVTTGPGVHTCGEWAPSNSAVRRPSGGSGYYAIANNECNALLGRTSTTMTSPSVDVDLANLIGVTLEYDIWYNHNGGESAKVEVYDGANWIPVWQSTGSDLNGRQVIDVTAYAAGNSDFRVRFDYQNATQDKWFSLDNVQVVALIDVACGTAALGPASVPDGSLGASPLLGNRMSAAGDTIALAWDHTTCSAPDYNLLWGNLTDVATASIAGSECALGANGSYTWNGVPAGDLYFLLVGTDGTATVESSWGVDGNGGERGGFNASGECGATFKETDGTCP